MNELIFRLQLLSLLFIISVGLNAILLAALIIDTKKDTTKKVKKEE